MLDYIHNVMTNTGKWSIEWNEVSNQYHVLLYLSSPLSLKTKKKYKKKPLAVLMVEHEMVLKGTGIFWWETETNKNPRTLLKSVY